MEVLSESVVFAANSKRGGRKRRREEGTCRVLSVNFRKLRIAGNTDTCCEWSCEELMHSVAGLCSACLPDMEVSAIYSSLTAPGTRTVLLLDKEPQVGVDRSVGSQEGRDDSEDQEGVGLRPQPAVEDLPKEEKVSNDSVVLGCLKDDEAEEETSVAELFSASESEHSDSESESDQEDELALGRKQFLSAAIARRQTGRTGPEHCVVGCVTVLRLSSKPESSAVQILLLVVRRGWRGLGAGSYLLQCSKDPDIVGHYDVLLVFADHRAETFFTQHGFTDDPIITSAHRGLVDSWVNSTLMAYLTPFSGQTFSTGSLKSLTNMEDHYRQWRLSAITTYCCQLSFMERLRHEVLLLHTKVQSHEEVIVELSRELRQVREEKAVVEAEFAQYRKHTQKLLCEAAVSSADQWLDSLKDANT